MTTQNNKLVRILAHKTVCVDLDMTLVVSKYPYVHCLLPDVKRKLQEMKDAGMYILIYTTRVNGQWDHKSVEEMVEDVENILDEYKIPYDEIWSDRGKPYYRWYIGDECYRADIGNFAIIADRVIAEYKNELPDRPDIFECATINRIRKGLIYNWRCNDKPVSKLYAEREDKDCSVIYSDEDGYYIATIVTGDIERRYTFEVDADLNITILAQEE